MRHKVWSLIGACAVTLVGATLDAQTIDSAQVRFQQASAIQYLRPQDKRGLNLFETPKVAGAEYRGFALQWGAAFTQQFQALSVVDPFRWSLTLQSGESIDASIPQSVSP